MQKINQQNPKNKEPVTCGRTVGYKSENNELLENIHSILEWYGQSFLSPCWEMWWHWNELRVWPGYWQMLWPWDRQIAWVEFW